MKRFRMLSQNAATRLDEPRLSVAPLIDVCFLLIVYFLVTTTILPAEQDITTTPPGDVMDQPRIPSPPVMVLVRDDGMFSVQYTEGKRGEERGREGKRGEAEERLGT